MSVASPFSVYNISYLVAEFKERIKFRPLILGCRGFPAGGVCQVFCVSFLEKILWGGEPPPL